MAKGKESTWVDLPLIIPWEMANRNPNAFACEYSSSTQSTAQQSLLNVNAKQKMVNWLPIKTGDTVSLTNRNYAAPANTLFAKGAGTLTNPRGIFWGSVTQRLCEVWNTNLYVWTDNDTYRTTALTGTVADGGPCGFVEGTNTTPASYIFASAVGESVVVLAGSDTTVSDADFPASVIPMPVYIDGYIFIAQQGTRNIFNSTVGDPLTWTATGFISAEETGGNIVALARHKKYVVALCENHIEFFRDAAIPAPNSPLQRVPELGRKIGCINRASVVTEGDTIYFAGREGSTFNFYTIKDDKIINIGNPSLSWYLSIHGGATNTNGIPQFGVLTTWNQSTTIYNFGVAKLIPFKGKNYYCFVANAGRPIVTGTSLMRMAPCLIYDPELNWWGEIAMGFRNTALTSSIFCGGWGFPYGTAIRVPTNTAEALIYQYVMMNSGGGADDDHLAYLSETTNTAEVINSGTGNGFSVINVRNFHQILWPVMDFGIGNRKSINGLQIISDGLVSDLPFANESLTVGILFSNYGSYLNNSNPTTAFNYALNNASYTPAQGEVSQILRTRISPSFYSQWFGLQQAQSEAKTILAIRVLLSVFEEA